jgi:hypothetical protein
MHGMRFLFFLFVLCGRGRVCVLWLVLCACDGCAGGFCVFLVRLRTLGLGLGACAWAVGVCVCGGARVSGPAMRRR